MNCYPYFDYDYSKRVMRLQHSCYGQLVGTLALTGVQYALAAERLLGLEESRLGTFALQFKDFDHRTLQDMHDRIAAAFRFAYFRHPLLAELEDLDGTERLWQDYAVAELHALMQHTAFARGFFEALRFANKQRGLAGEETMKQVQTIRYRSMAERAHPSAKWLYTPPPSPQR